MATSACPARSGLMVRPAQAQDAAGLARLLGVLGYPCDREEAAARLRAIEDEAGQQVLVADRHGELDGLVAIDLRYYLPLGATTCRITALAVAPDDTRRGIGRICSLEQVDYIITDALVPQETVRMLTERGVKVIIAE